MYNIILKGWGSRMKKFKPIPMTFSTFKVDKWQVLNFSSQQDCKFWTFEVGKWQDNDLLV